MTRLIRWLPDDQSAAILAAYARRREPLRSVLRRALKLLATADGLLNTRGHVVVQPGHRRRQP
ncbi:hypothetical protein ACFYY9_26345 [Streptomyces nigra]|uniref:hypothetical protein n=1 Tax=Streptomyces nigra TaxID=1827580 RepID=UPI0036A6D9E0